MVLEIPLSLGVLYERRPDHIRSWMDPWEMEHSTEEDHEVQIMEFEQGTQRTD